MSRRRNTPEEQLSAVHDYLSGKRNAAQIGQQEILLRLAPMKSGLQMSLNSKFRKPPRSCIYYYNHGRYQERYNNLVPMEVRTVALAAQHPQQYPIPENKKIAACWASIEAKKSA